MSSVNTFSCFNPASWSTAAQIAAAVIVIAAVVALVALATLCFLAPHVAIPVLSAIAASTLYGGANTLLIAGGSALALALVTTVTAIALAFRPAKQVPIHEAPQDDNSLNSNKDVPGSMSTGEIKEAGSQQTPIASPPPDQQKPKPPKPSGPPPKPPTTTSPTPSGSDSRARELTTEQKELLEVILKDCEHGELPVKGWVGKAFTFDKDNNLHFLLTQKSNEPGADLKETDCSITAQDISRCINEHLQLQSFVRCRGITALTNKGLMATPSRPLIAAPTSPPTVASQKTRTPIFTPKNQTTQ